MPPKQKNPLYHLVKKVRTECPADDIVVGCSGGKDSKTLVGLLQQAGKNVVVVHVDHGLRLESAEEQVELKKWADGIGVPFIGETVSLSSGAEGPAREARRKALLRQARKLGIKCIALGHTARDQLETILMRITRGTGLTGIGGIKEISYNDGVCIYRPLLGTTQKEIYAYLEYRGWSPIEDPSNQSDAYTRNRFRKEVIPFFLRENSRLEKSVHTMAKVLQLDADALDYYTRREWDAFVQSGFNISILNGDMPEAIKRRLIILFWQRHAKTGCKQISSKHVDAVLYTASQERGTTCLPGLTVRVEQGRLKEVGSGTRPRTKGRVHYRARSFQGTKSEGEGTNT